MIDVSFLVTYEEFLVPASFEIKNLFEPRRSARFFSEQNYNYINNSKSCEQTHKSKKQRTTNNNYNVAQSSINFWSLYRLRIAGLLNFS